MYRALSYSLSTWKAFLKARIPVTLIFALIVLMTLPPQTAEILRSFAEDALIDNWLRLSRWALLGILLLFGSMFAVGFTFRNSTHLWQARATIIVFVLIGPLIANAIAFWKLSELSLSCLLLASSFVVAAISCIVVHHFETRSNNKPWSMSAWTVVGCILLATALFANYFPSPAPLALTARISLLVIVFTLLCLPKTEYRFLIFSLIVIWFVCFNLFDWNDHHKIAMTDTTVVTKDVDKDLEIWLERRGDAAAFRDGYPIVLVAAEGGGIRAAYFTDLVLEELRHSSPNFQKHLYMIAAVSGGSVGAAAYAEAIHQNLDAPQTTHQANAAQNKITSGKDASDVQALQRDFLSTSVRRFSGGDLANQFLPASFELFDDRARLLDREFEASWKDHTGHNLAGERFQSVRLDPSTDVPALVLLTTDVTTGHRMAISHVRMPGSPRAPTSGCRVRDDDKEANAEKSSSATGPRLWTLAEEFPKKDVDLATAAFMSARFPIVSPAATLPCEGNPRRYVDGGYFENSGVTTLIDVFHAVRAVAAEKHSPILILKIENGAAYDGSDKSFLPVGTFSEFLSPVRAMLQTRSARGELATVSLDTLSKTEQEQCKRVSAIAEFKDKNKGNPDVEKLVDAVGTCVQLFTETIALDYSKNVPIPLGWWLTSAAGAEMNRQLSLKADRLDRIRRFLAPLPPGQPRTF